MLKNNNYIPYHHFELSLCSAGILIFSGHFTQFSSTLRAARALAGEMDRLYSGTFALSHSRVSPKGS